MPGASVVFDIEHQLFGEPAKTYQCFKCGSAGNHLDLWAAISKKNLYDAAIDLCNRLNREVPRLQS